MENSLLKRIKIFFSKNLYHLIYLPIYIIVIYLWFFYVKSTADGFLDFGASLMGYTGIVIINLLIGMFISEHIDEKKMEAQMAIIAFIYLAFVVIVLAIGTEIQDIQKYQAYGSENFDLIDVFFNIFGYGFALSIFSIIPFIFGNKIYKKYLE